MESENLTHIQTITDSTHKIELLRDNITSLHTTIQTLKFDILTLQLQKQDLELKVGQLREEIKVKTDRKNELTLQNIQRQQQVSEINRLTTLLNIEKLTEKQTIVQVIIISILILLF